MFIEGLCSQRFRQALNWIEPGTLNGPGVADMKSGLSLMLAALEAVEVSPLADRIGYQVMINSDEETGSLSSAKLIADCARGKHAEHRPHLPGRFGLG